MASAATPNLGLPQWTSGESLPGHIMNDFNAAFLAIDDYAGAVTPAGKVFCTTSQNVNNGSVTVLTFNTELINTDGIANLAANGARLTCRTAGLYLIFGTVKFSPNANGKRELTINFNENNPIGSSVISAAPAGESTVVQVSAIHMFAVNEFVVLYAYQTSGSTLAIEVANTFSPIFDMVKIG